MRTTLEELQRQIVDTRRQRGFTTDPVQLVVLLAEEIGEVAAEVKRTWSHNYGDFDSTRLGNELADVLALLCALASAADIDIEDAIDRKFFKSDGERHWRSADPP